MENSVITNLSANSYNGQFAFNDATGSFNCDGAKNLNSIMGTKEDVGSFDAYGTADQMSFNLHPVSLDKATELASLAGDIVSAVQSELSE